MNYATPDFENLLKFYPAVGEQSQVVGKIFVDAATDIAREQAQAAETLVEFGSKALRPPQTTEPTEMLSAQFELQSKLFESLSTSADRIFTIASDAGTKAFNAWMELSDTPADGTDA
jgi:hypothetical protein